MIRITTDVEWGPYWRVDDVDQDGTPLGTVHFVRVDRLPNERGFSADIDI